MMASLSFPSFGSKTERPTPPCSLVFIAPYIIYFPIDSSSGYFFYAWKPALATSGALCPGKYTIETRYTIFFTCNLILFELQNFFVKNRFGLKYNILNLYINFTTLYKNIQVYYRKLNILKILRIKILIEKNR